MHLSAINSCLVFLEVLIVDQTHQEGKQQAGGKPTPKLTRFLYFACFYSCSRYKQKEHAYVCM